MLKERKNIKAGNQLIHQVIYNQAGSIQKALLEYIMNSVDANATKIEINLEDNGINYSIKDDGDGFGDKNYTLEEKKKCIDEVFGHLGFDHGSDEDNYRVYGKFGIGRAQLWAFSKNSWHTHDMTMDVDIKNNGLEYEITQIDKYFKGCSIVGEFYDRILPNEIILIKRELSLMSAFAPIEVYFNGTKINKKMSDIKSNINIPNIHVELKRTSGLKVYNQGVFVREFPNYLFGVGGIVCSDIGYPFELNAARNDILQSRCKLWKVLKKTMDLYLGKETKKTKITDEIRKTIITKIAAGDYGELDYNGYEYLKKPLFKMINNRYISIMDFVNNKSHFTITKLKSDALAEKIHSEGVYKVLLQEFTDFMGVNEEDFCEKLKEVFLNINKKRSVNYTPLEKLKEDKDDSLITIEDKKLTKRQKLFLEAINLSNVHNPLLKGREKRKILLGKSERANAWTNGKTYIVLNEDLVKDLDRGAGYALKIINLLIHEYNHDDDNNDLHSIDFYENYHNQTIYDANHIFISLNYLLKAYTSRLIKNDFVIPKKLNRSLHGAEMI